MDNNIEKVREAFSRQALSYDSYEEGHEILKWMRSQVHRHTLSYLNPGDNILEINAGTGIDAVYFAKLGYKVHATDLSDEMLNQLKIKVETFKLNDKITFQQCSYSELSNTSTKYDFIFSNFGGLNCTPDLNPVAGGIAKLLKPGGMVTLVIMPPFCPWEVALVFRGYFKTAFRRFHKNGVEAHIEGIYFKTHYYTPGQVLKTFKKYAFKKMELQGLGSVVPPPYMSKFPKRFPGLYKFLVAAETKLSHFPPFNFWADHFILTLQYTP